MLVTARLSEIPDIFALLALLEKHQIGHLPILDDGQALIGLISAGDLLASHGGREVRDGHPGNGVEICDRSTATEAKKTEEPEVLNLDKGAVDLLF